VIIVSSDAVDRGAVLRFLRSMESGQGKENADAAWAFGVAAEFVELLSPVDELSNPQPPIRLTRPAETTGGEDD